MCHFLIKKQCSSVITMLRYLPPFSLYPEFEENVEQPKSPSLVLKYVYRSSCVVHGTDSTGLSRRVSKKLYRNFYHLIKNARPICPTCLHKPTCILTFNYETAVSVRCEQLTHFQACTSVFTTILFVHKLESKQRRRKKMNKYFLKYYM